MTFTDYRHVVISVMCTVGTTAAFSALLSCISSSSNPKLMTTIMEEEALLVSLKCGEIAGWLS